MTTNKPVRKNKKALLAGLLFGIIFGFLLHKGGVTKYDVIIGQLLLYDFTVLKIMMSAVVTGMIGVYAMASAGIIQLSLKSGSIGQNVIGGLFFGVGFGILGYCPGTLAGAIGNGYLDALTGGIVGIIIGSGIFAALYTKLNKTILHKGNYGDMTLPQLFKVNPWVVIIPLATLIILLLAGLEKAGY